LLLENGESRFPLTFRLRCSSSALGAKRIKGVSPLISPAERGVTPLDSPKGETGVVRVAGDVDK
jgi:hypothetical protein